jgi:hypothetical protein
MMARIAEQTDAAFEGKGLETKASHRALTSMEWTGHIRMHKDGLT